MSFGLSFLYEPMRSIDSATFTASYQTLGTPLVHPAVIIKLVNNSDRLVILSEDGVTDCEAFPGGFFTLYDFGANKGYAPTGCKKIGTQFYVRGAAGGTGLIYLSVQYLSEGI